MNFYLHLGNCQSHFEHLTDQSGSPNMNRIFDVRVWFTDLNQLQSVILSPDYITEAQLHWKFSSASHYKIYILRKSVPSGIQNRNIGFHSVVLGGCLAAAHHPSNILLKVCVLVVQIRPWHVLWLSPLLQLVSWGGGLGVLSHRRSAVSQSGRGGGSGAGVWESFVTLCSSSPLIP